jgi:hypothetical protein
MTTVATVFRAGGEYQPWHVQMLAKNVARGMNDFDYRFVALSDEPIKGVQTKPLYLPPPAAPGWWAKVELFRPRAFDGPVLYLDLDTIVREPGALRALVKAGEGPITMLRDHRYPEIVAGSGIMWIEEPDALADVWERYLDEPQAVQARYAGLPHIGDQALIQQVATDRGLTIHRWQDLLPEGYLRPLHSVDIDLPAGAICYGDYRPKPWDIPGTKRLSREWQGTA